MVKSHKRPKMSATGWTRAKTHNVKKLNGRLSKWFISSGLIHIHLSSLFCSLYNGPFLMEAGVVQSSPALLICFSFCILFFSHPLSHLLHRPIRTFSISKSIFQTLQLPFILMFFVIHRERLWERWGAAHLEKAENNLFIFKNHQPLHAQTSSPLQALDQVWHISLSRALSRSLLLSRSVLEDERQMKCS